MTDTAELERKLRELQAQVKEADRALTEARRAADDARMEPLKALVVRAHNALCQWNHTDGCSWGYEESSSDPWRCEAHARWLRHYDALVNGSSYAAARASLAEVEILISSVEAVKPKVGTALWLLRHGLVP